MKHHPSVSSQRKHFLSIYQINFHCYFAQVFFFKKVFSFSSLQHSTEQFDYVLLAGNILSTLGTFKYIGHSIPLFLASHHL